MSIVYWYERYHRVIRDHFILSSGYSNSCWLFDIYSWTLDFYNLNTRLSYPEWNYLGTLQNAHDVIWELYKKRTKSYYKTLSSFTGKTKKKNLV